MTAPAMGHEVFISYASPDLARARAVCSELKRDGMSCWIAKDDMPTGADWDSTIAEAITASKLVVVILSAHANASRQVAKEVALADNENKLLAPVRVEDVEPEGGLKYHLTRPQWINAFPPPLEEHLSSVSFQVKRALRGERERRAQNQRDTGRPPTRRWPWLLLGFGALLLLSYVALYNISGGVNRNTADNMKGAGAQTPTPQSAASPTRARGQIKSLRITFKSGNDAKDPEDTVFVSVKDGPSGKEIFKREMGAGELWEKYKDVRTLVVALPAPLTYAQCNQLALVVSKTASDRGWKASTKIEGEVDGETLVLMDEQNTQQFELPENRPTTVTRNFRCPP